METMKTFNSDKVEKKISQKHFSGEKIMREYRRQNHSKILPLLFVFLLLSCLLVLSVASYAQESTNMTGKVEFSQKMVSFTITAHEGKVYLNWLIKGEKEDGFYIVERSKDGKTYEQVGLKEGIGTELNVELLYSWVDRFPLESGTGYYYRLKYVTSDDGFYVYQHEVISPVKEEIEVKKEIVVSTAIM